MIEELELFNKINKAEHYLARLERKNKNEYLKLNGRSLKYEINSITESIIFLSSYNYSPRLIAYVLSNLEDKIVNMPSDLETTFTRLGNKEKYREWIDFLENPNIYLKDEEHSLNYDIDNLVKLNFLVLESARRGPSIGPDLTNERVLNNHLMLKLATLNSIRNENMVNSYKINFNYDDIKKMEKLKQRIEYYKENLKA